METKNDFVVFLGVCESSLIRGDGILQDFYGVGELLLLPFFPQNLNGIFLLMGISKKMIEQKKQVKIIIEDRSTPTQTASICLEGVTIPATGMARVHGFSKPYTKINGKTICQNYDHRGRKLLIPQDFAYKLISLPCPPLFVFKPTVIDVMLVIDSEKTRIGSFECKFVPTIPISEAERLAIMSRPGAIKGLTYVIGCKQCNKKIELNLLLEPSNQPSHDMQESKNLLNAADEWKCKCGKIKVSLCYLKQGFHEMFRRIDVTGQRKDLSFVPLYERGAIAAITSEYLEVLSRDGGKDEEAIQKYMEEKPILWNFLGPARIWKKPPILAKYNADFGILTKLNVLYFVEIEKPVTKMIKINGGIHSQLQAGLDQIRNWQKEVERRREAVLDGLGLTQQAVHKIRYILIAGMRNRTSPEGLETIRNMKTNADSIFCFDELATFLHSTEIALLNV